MKKLLFIMLLLAIYLAAQTANLETEERIRQVENSLTPTLIYGDSLLNGNLRQRMIELKVPGVSIAVIKDYKIEWAKAYGRADSLEGREATITTRFQAASTSANH